MFSLFPQLLQLDSIRLGYFSVSRSKPGFEKLATRMELCQAFYVVFELLHSLLLNLHVVVKPTGLVNASLYRMEENVPSHKLERIMSMVIVVYFADFGKVVLLSTISCEVFNR